MEKSLHDRLKEVKSINSDAKEAIKRVSIEVNRFYDELPDLRIEEAKQRSILNKIRLKRESMEARLADATAEIEAWEQREAATASDIRAINNLLK